MPVFGIDYAAGDPQPSRLKAAGVNFVCRYVSTPGNPKNLRPSEAKRLRDAGIDVVVVFETTATRALAGKAAGAFDAKRALAQARDCMPQEKSPIYFAVDYDASRAEVDGPIADYFSGVRAALNGAAGYRIGVYGSGLCCGAMVDRGLAALSRLAQSRGYCGSEAYAQAMRYDLIQSLGARISVDGAPLDIDPDASHPERDPGLFMLAA